MEIKEAFMAVVELAEALGVERIDRLPGCWEHKVDAQWFIAVNGHTTPKAIRGFAGGAAAMPGEVLFIDPLHVYLEFNGFPAGIIGMRSGLLAAGSAANEDTLIAALRAATARAKAGRS
jgi:hypothetical protein